VYLVNRLIAGSRDGNRLRILRSEKAAQP